MRHLLNTLFVLTEDSYLSLDGENVVVQREQDVLGRFPLHTLESILYFGYKGASPALMGACAKRNVSLCFMTPRGRFLARSCGETRGNVLLRKEQYRVSDSPERSGAIAGSFIAGKLHNARWVLERATRDHPMRVDVEQLKEVSAALAAAAKAAMEIAAGCGDGCYWHIAHEGQNAMEIAAGCEGGCGVGGLEGLRGVEGKAAVQYFEVFDQLLLQNKEAFFFNGRSRRPPLDNVNAMLSFAYAILANDCAAALEAAGLDPYVGFLHRDRSGRASLALDVMEELRPAFADRFVISCVNNHIVKPVHFEKSESGAVNLTDDGRRAFLGAYQERKREKITHPFLGEKLAWGLVPYVQALLLARHLRGDLDAYPAFLWK